MTGFLRVIIFFLVFLIAVRLFRVLKRFWSSSKETVNIMKNMKSEEKQNFRDIEEAEFREIPSEKKNGNGEKRN
jgi:hypothetical protein